jgi:hypothetical protein
VFEDGPHVVVGHEVAIALTVALFNVREAVPFLGWRRQRLGQHGEGASFDCDLAAPGAKKRAAGADDVSQVGQIEGFYVGGLNVVAAHVDLDAACAVNEIDEGR